MRHAPAVFLGLFLSRRPGGKNDLATDTLLGQEIFDARAADQKRSEQRFYGV